MRPLLLSVCCLSHTLTHTCKVCACAILLPFLFMTHTGKCDGGKWNHSLLMGRTQRAWFSPLASEVTLMTSYKWRAAVCTGRVLSEILCCFCKWERQNVPQYLYPDRLYTKFVSREIILMLFGKKNYDKASLIKYRIDETRISKTYLTPRFDNIKSQETGCQLI